MADRESGSPPLSYDPAADVAERYPDWTVCSVDLGGIIPEVLSRSRRVILLERTQDVPARRCSLAHAVAHLDLDHGETPTSWFEMREETAADDLAARRLIPLRELARALAWSRDRDEVARELVVDLPMLQARESRMPREERRRLRRWLVGTQRDD